MTYPVFKGRAPGSACREPARRAPRHSQAARHLRISAESGAGIRRFDSPAALARELQLGLDYDINALSNFVADAPRVLGFDPFARLADCLESEIARGRRPASRSSAQVTPAERNGGVPHAGAARG